MKNVILYVRVSTDEQAKKGFSLRDQEAKLLQYSRDNGMHVLQTYREDYSAKTFNRPEFKKLLEYCKKNFSSIDELLFVKWDRFSRNTAESYNKINLFTELGIKVNAITQPLDLTIPEQGLMLAVYLSIPEVENQRKSQNVIAGRRRAFKEGRYVGSPPKGYSVGRDSTNKPILVPNNDAPYILEAFELMATGVYNLREVFNKLKDKGYKSSKTAFSNMIRNPLYSGLVYLSAYRDEKEQFIEGIHEPIITRMLYSKVQDVINGRNKQKGLNHKKVNPAFPLRGFLMCPKCDKPLSGSISTGRNKKYAYYHCFSPCDIRIKQEDAHSWFHHFLRSISLDENAYELLVEIIKNEFDKINKQNKVGPKQREKLKNLEEKLIKVQDLFIDGDLTKEEYQNHKKNIENLINEAKDRQIQFSKKKEVFDLYKNGLKSMQNIENQYIKSDVEFKRRLIGSIFPEKFQFQNKKVRTADINPILHKIAHFTRVNKENKKRDKSQKKDLSRCVAGAGLEPATFGL